MMGERPACPALPVLIAFDADDTLWENEIYFETAKDRFKDLLAADCDPAWTERELYETEMRNLSHFGYGIKGFTLSMIETALDLTKGAVTGRQIRQILDYGKEMLQMPIEPLPYVEEVLTHLSRTHPLMLLTKGDLFDQEAKIARSGLADHFTHIEIVSEKNEGTYAALLQRHGIQPADFLHGGQFAQIGYPARRRLGRARGLCAVLHYLAPRTRRAFGGRAPAIPPTSPPRRTAPPARRAVRFHRPKLKL